MGGERNIHCKLWWYLKDVLWKLALQHMVFSFELPAATIQIREYFSYPKAVKTIFAYNFLWNVKSIIPEKRAKKF